MNIRIVIILLEGQDVVDIDLNTTTSKNGQIKRRMRRQARQIELDINEEHDDAYISSEIDVRTVIARNLSIKHGTPQRQIVGVVEERKIIKEIGAELPRCDVRSKNAFKMNHTRISIRLILQGVRVDVSLILIKECIAVRERQTGCVFILDSELIGCSWNAEGTSDGKLFIKSRIMASIPSQ